MASAKDVVWLTISNSFFILLYTIFSNAKDEIIDGIIAEQHRMTKYFGSSSLIAMYLTIYHSQTDKIEVYTMFLCLIKFVMLMKNNVIDMKKIINILIKCQFEI